MRLLGLVFIGLACCDGSPTEPSEPAICLQTFEFGNYGCGRIVGRLTGTAGQPVSSAQVRVRPRADDTAAYTAPTDLTSSGGGYELLVRAMGPGPVIGDTVTMIFSYTYPPGSDAPVSDSIPITVRFAAVGERAPITRLNLSVPVPP